MYTIELNILLSTISNVPNIFSAAESLLPSFTKHQSYMNCLVLYVPDTADTCTCTQIFWILGAKKDLHKFSVPHAESDTRKACIVEQLL